MKTLTRTITAAAAVTAAMTLTAATALAGNWADATVTPTEEQPPTAGQETELVISLLQHGVTPVDFGTVTLTAVNTATGERSEHRASSRGDGEWVVEVSFAIDGTWNLTVAHSDLEVSAVEPIQVAAATSGTDGAATVLPIGLGAATIALVLALTAGAVWLGRGHARVGPVRRARALAGRLKA